jgi:hypothetical protein
MKVRFGDYDCHVLFHEYAHGGNTAIQLVDDRDGMPVATATVNPGSKLDKDIVCIKTYSENKGMLQALMQAGIVSEPLYTLQMGFVEVPVCKLLVPALQNELIKEIAHVNFVAEVEEMLTFEFVTVEDVWLAEPEMETDLFRLFIWKDGRKEIFEAHSEDYDVFDEYTHLFDVEAIHQACEKEAKEKILENHTEEFELYWQKSKEELPF